MATLRVISFHLFAFHLLLCGGCDGCYDSSTRRADAEIEFDARRPDVGTTETCPESTEPRLDPDMLPSCGMVLTSDLHPIETVSEGCERYLGGVGFPYASGEDLRELEGLRWIDGGIGMNANGDLRSLRGVEQIEHLGSLLILSQPHIDSLAPFGRLRVVEGLLTIASNRSLASLHGLERLEEVGELQLAFLPEHRDRVSLEPLRCLRRVRGDVAFERVPREEVDAFLARVEVGGTVTLDREVIVEGTEGAP